MIYFFMKNLLLIAFIILFLTSACSNKQPEVVIETNQAKNVSTEEVVEKLHPMVWLFPTPETR